MAIEQAPAESPMEAFYKQLHAKHLDALWRHEGGEPAPNPETVRPPYDPCHWRWSDIEPFVTRATELVQPSHEDQRRALTLNNPSVKPRSAATHTISGAIQCVLPGEIAPSHRTRWRLSVS